ncbi:MAG TPA: cysteine hydrolase family protein, partial [Ktedonobacteraceae bacterium]|nr:cysteine hydrolase family protein [Ktedonobacteraceae bacterium]
VMNRFPSNTALILIDIQKGFDEPYWGRRNNLDAEANAASLLEAWRDSKRPIFHIQHLSFNPNSPLHSDHPGHHHKDLVRLREGEPLLTKHVNSAFIGTTLEQQLRVQGITSVVITGLTTNHCVETTTRMAGNLGFDTYLVSDATATFDRTGPDGVHHTAEEIQSMTISNLNEEFATIVTTAEVLQAIKGPEAAAKAGQ